MDYEDYGCELVKDNRFVVYRFLENFKEDAATLLLC